MKNLRPTIITGFMGAGKTTIAAALARRLSCAVFDLDQFIAERSGRSVGAIIDEDGEARFRALESDVLHDVLHAAPASIVALGGGAWMLEKNRALIAEHNAFTVWLDTPFELCWHRITFEGSVRPLARNLEAARRLYDERQAIYQLAALHVKVSEENSVNDLVEEITDALLQLERNG